jgi:LysM repeat protein
MNNPNPFVPQGSLLEQQNKRRSRIKVGVFCVLAVGIVGLTAMLIQGCKREQTETENQSSLDTNETAMNTNVPSAMEASNPPVQPPSAVTPQPVAPPVTEATTTEYVVVKGDSFSKIAKKFGVSVKAIKEANSGVEPTKLKVGQKLSIPAASGGATAPAAESALAPAGSSTAGETYTVKSGDTLTKIAKAHGTTIKAIESENNLSTTKIKVGQKLKIPTQAEVAAPVSAPVAPAPVPPQSTVPAPASAPGQ